MKIDENTSNLLNFSRWVAALLVVLGHVRAIYFQSYMESCSNAAGRLFYFLTGFGQESVVIFICLSGYLVGGKLITSFSQNQFKVTDFIFNRINRIYIVLIPAIIIGALLDFIGIRYFDFNHIYENAFAFPSCDYSIRDRFAIKNLIATLLMQQTVLTDTFGSNSPLWTLAYECWYYILFPLVLSVLYIKEKVVIKVLFIISIVIYLLIYNPLILFYFIIWILGALFYHVNINNEKWQSITLIPFLICIVVSRLKLIPNPYLVHLGIALSYMLIVISKKSKLWILTKFIRTNKLFASFSYSVYVLHFPIVVFISAISSNKFNFALKGNMSVHSVSFYIATIIVVYSLSYVFYLQFEKSNYKLLPPCRKLD